FAHALTSHYGERARDRFSVAIPIAIEMAADLVPYVEGPNEIDRLNPAVRKLVETMRQRIQQEIGIIVPGVNFRPNYSLSTKAYSILLDDVPRASGTVAAELADPGNMEPVILHLEQVVHENLAGFFGHDEVLTLIQKHVPDVHAHLRAHADEVAELKSVLAS